MNLEGLPAHAVFPPVACKTMIGLTICISLFSAASDSCPATDTAFVLGRRWEQAAVGKHSLVFQNKGFQRNLGGELAAAGICIRQYGISGLSGISRRGADPSQIQVLWNGIALNSPMLGMADLTLLTGANTGEITLTEGGSSSFYGSGSVGGTLAINQLPPENAGFKASLSAQRGSYGLRSFSGNAAMASSKAYINCRAALSQAENNFVYALNPGEKPRFTMSNASTSSFVSAISAGFNHRKWETVLNAEWQTNHRELGTPAGGGAGLGTQSDANTRLVLSTVYNAKSWKWVQRAGFISDIIAFQHLVYPSPDTSISNNRQLQQEWHFPWFKAQFIIGNDLSWQSGKTKNYRQDYERIFPAQFINVTKRISRHLLAAGFRWEWREKIPVASLSSEHGLGGSWTLKSSFSNSFRRPTFNDLYWAEGGNSALKAEQGGNAEFGIHAKKQFAKTQWKAAFTGWLRYLINPIIWLPQNNLWRASNMERGDYKGVQVFASVSKTLGQTNWELYTSAEYTHAVMQDAARQYQGIFIPAITGACRLSMRFKGWSAQAAVNGQSARFMSTDNQYSLPGYALVSMHAGKELFFNKSGLDIQFGGDNLLNAVYQVMPGRPMPMRNIWVKINIQISKKILLAEEINTE